MRGGLAAATSLLAATSAAGCATPVPEGCYRQAGHPIPTPEGRLIFTLATIVCPGEPTSSGGRNPASEKEALS